MRLAGRGCKLTVKRQRPANESAVRLVSCDSGSKSLSLQAEAPDRSRERSCGLG